MSERTHDLKIWPEHFAAVVSGDKTFEVRVNDRDYQVGDVLHLQEYDPEDERYSGAECWVRVGLVCHIPHTENLVGMSIEPVGGTSLERLRKIDARHAEMVNDLLAGYTWGFDQGSGDDACLVIHEVRGNKSRIKVIVYGRLARALAVAMELLRSNRDAIALLGKEVTDEPR